MPTSIDMMNAPLLTVSIKTEQDIVLARHRARQVALLLGFESQDQTRIATAVSEIARNAYQYAGGGRVDFQVEGVAQPQLLTISILDRGPGIPNVPEILAGRFKSETGMGLGIVGARRLMDRFHIESLPNAGTTIRLNKLIPRKTPLITARDRSRMTDELARARTDDPFQEVQRQNQELLRTLEELHQRQEELSQLNRELEDTNRGVIALYAELDEKAAYLRRADEMKSRFLSNMSHEFRTPLNSILAISGLLKSRADGDLTAEQEKQVIYIQQAATNLSDLVNDLLDLAKIEAGKTEVRPSEFRVDELFSALRGMLRPLLLNQSVELVFEVQDGIPPIFSDEPKISQILRNLISNALKFTEKGEVRVSATAGPHQDAVIFTVKDTGIGIPEANLATVFQEFTQLENPLQKRVKGTGLGLPLSKKLAELLGGMVTVDSQVGVGSQFSAVIPLRYETAFSESERARSPVQPDPLRTPILVVEAGPETLLLYEKFLKGTGFQLIPARTVHEARRELQRVRPAAILLDILPPGGDAWGFLAEVKSAPGLLDIPMLVISTIDDRQKALSLGADAYAVKPLERLWLMGQLKRLTGRGPMPKVLIIDDEEVSRYLLKQAFRETHFMVLEAQDGARGLAIARSEQPQLVFLDLVMPGLSGEEVLTELRRDPQTRRIPVVIITSKVLTDQEKKRLEPDVFAVYSKEVLSLDQGISMLRKDVLKVAAQ